MMNPGSNELIDQLVDDLAPVRPIRTIHGILLTVSAVLVTLLLVEWFEGLRREIFSGSASDFFFITNGMLAVLGSAAALAVVRMVNPRVGNGHDGARWSAVMLALLPLTAVLMLGLGGLRSEFQDNQAGLACLAAGTGFGLVTAGTLVFWLRWGAPVSLNAAGLLTGIAAGAIGSFASGIACPLETVGHLGLWHVAPVVVSAIIGRLVIPPLVRW